MQGIGAMSILFTPALQSVCQYMVTSALDEGLNLLLFHLSTSLGKLGQLWIYKAVFDLGPSIGWDVLSQPSSHTYCGWVSYCTSWDASGE